MSRRKVKFLHTIKQAQRPQLMEAGTTRAYWQNTVDLKSAFAKLSKLPKRAAKWAGL